MYYIYQLVDPRTDLPFYIGKGQGNRCDDHFLETELNTDNRHKFYKIQFLQARGTPATVEKIVEGISSEDDAYQMETELILKYGRIGFEEGGILTNVCLGNQPPSHKGRPKTCEHRKSLSNSRKGKVMTEETKKKILESKRTNGTMKSGMQGKNHSEEAKEKIRKKKLGSTMSEESSSKKSEKLKGKPWSEARRLAAQTQRKSGPKPK